MSPLIRRFGLASLLVSATAGCAVDSFGYTPTCGPADPPEACRNRDEPRDPWDRIDNARAIVTLNATGLTQYHYRDDYYYGFVGVDEAGRMVVRTLVDPVDTSFELWLMPGKLTLTYVGFVDGAGADAPYLHCETPEPVRTLQLEANQTAQVVFPLTCTTG